MKCAIDTDNILFHVTIVKQAVGEMCSEYSFIAVQNAIMNNRFNNFIILLLCVVHVQYVQIVPTLDHRWASLSRDWGLDGQEVKSSWTKKIEVRGQNTNDYDRNSKNKPKRNNQRPRKNLNTSNVYDILASDLVWNLRV